MYVFAIVYVAETFLSIAFCIEDIVFATSRMLAPSYEDDLGAPGAFAIACLLTILCPWEPPVLPVPVFMIM